MNQSQSGANQSPAPIHLALKVRSEGGLTIAGHHEMLASASRCIFGKFGTSIGATTVAALQRQIEDGTPTYLFLVLKKGWREKFQIYSARLSSISLELSEQDIEIIPQYYRSQWKSISTALEIVTLDLVPQDSHKLIAVAGSGRELLSVLGSSATTFVVTKNAQGIV